MKLADAYVDINARTGGFVKGLGTVRGQLEGALNSMVLRLGGAFLGYQLLAKAGREITGAISGASNLNEVVNKTNVVFQDAAGSVIDFADEMADKFGLVKTTTLDAAGQLGLIAKASGLTAGEAAKLSTKMVSLAADASSFYNIPFEVALEKMRAGLVGEAEPLRTLGVLLSQSALDAEAARMGFEKVNGQFTEGQKVQARAAIIFRQMSDAQGDMERTQLGTANSARELAGRWENLSITLGQKLEPAYNSLLNLSNTVMMSMMEDVANAQGTFQGFADFIQGTVDTISTTFRNWTNILKLVGINIAEEVSAWGEVFGWLGDTIGAFGTWFSKNWKNLFIDAFTVVGTALSNLGTDFANFGKAAYDWIASGFTKPFAFKAVGVFEGMGGLKTEAFHAPKLVHTSGAAFEAQRQAIVDDIVKTEQKADAAKRTAAAAQAPKELPEELAAAAGKTKEKTAQASFVGAADLAKEIQKAALDQVQDKILVEHKKTNDLLGQIAEATVKQSGKLFARGIGAVFS